MSHLRPQGFFFFMVPWDVVKYEPLELSCQDKMHNSVPGPDLEMRWERGGKAVIQTFRYGEAVSQKIVFGPSALRLVQK